MKNSMIKLAVLAALGTSVQAFATGLVTIPAAGFASSAYTSCNTTGNFGSSTTTAPTAGANNTCAVFPAAEPTSPVSGYTLAVATTRSIPSVTGGTTSIGSLVDYVWRKPAATAPVTTTDMCIFGTRVGIMTNVAHGAPAGQSTYFEVDDVARGGFSGSGDVNAGYFVQSTQASPVYRIGRTFSSVQHRALAYDTTAHKATVGTNYLALPSKNSVTAAITGENTPIAAGALASTTLATQDAVVNANWVDFTADTVYIDDDGSTSQLSAVTYIQAACNSTAPSTWVKTGAIRLRQTGQENATFKEIAVDGYAPPGATVP
jgi:hypothetical protein